MQFTGQHILLQPLLHMQIKTQRREKLIRQIQLFQLLLTDLAGTTQSLRVGNPVTQKSHPAEQLNVAQSARRTFDVGFQLIHGIAARDPFFATRRHQFQNEP